MLLVSCHSSHISFLCLFLVLAVTSLLNLVKFGDSVGTVDNPKVLLDQWSQEINLLQGEKIKLVLPLPPLSF